MIGGSSLISHCWFSSSNLVAATTKMKKSCRCRQMSQCNTKKVDREYGECRLYWLQRGPLNWGKIVQGRSSRLPAQRLYLNLAVTVGSAVPSRLGTRLGSSVWSSLRHPLILRESRLWRWRETERAKLAAPRNRLQLLKCFPR